MLRSVQIPLLILLAATLTGCGETKTTSKAVAVLNMETVAMMTGADLSMQKAVQERNKQLNEGLSEFQAKIEAAWKEKQKEFGDKPNEEQTRQLSRIFQDLKSQSLQAQEKSRQNLMRFQQELANKFRELVSPISLEIAKEHGYSVVIIENPSLIAFDTAINITDLVVDRMKETKGDTSGLPTVGGTSKSPGAESKLPQLKQPNLAPLSTPQPKTKLKLPEIKTETDKKETPKEAPAKTEKEKPEVKATKKTADKPKAEAKPKVEPKPVTKKATEEKTSTEKPAKPPEKE